MTVSESSISKIEKRRVELEANVAKLQASLRHWQAWEIEYEGLKEEISNLGAEPSPAEVNNLAESGDEISVDSNKVLLTRKEKLLLIRDKKGVTRKPDQILNLLSRRLDYVQENIKSVGSLLEQAQKDLLASEVLTEAKALNEEGLPLIDILEELDEDGNVISSSTSVPGETVPNAVEAIERAAGLSAVERNGKKGDSAEERNFSRSSTDTTADSTYGNSSANDENSGHSKSIKNLKRPASEVESHELFETPQNIESSKTLKSSSDSKISHDSKPLPNPKTSKDPEIARNAEPQEDLSSLRKTASSKTVSPSERLLSPKKPESPKKQVSFVDDVDGVSASESARDHKAREQNLLQEISDREADELERNEMAESIIPEDESPEDALLRRQMIQYNMEEVGAVVAEIDLEDDALSQSEYDSDIDMEAVDEDGLDIPDVDEEEDEFGRTTKSKPLDAAYVRRMQALSDELKVSAMVNIGPGNSVETNETKDITKSMVPKASSKVASGGKKGVRFAEDLDIQEAPNKAPEVSNEVDEDPELSVASLLAASSAISGKPIAQMPGSKREQASNPSTNPISTKPSKFKTARTQAATNASIAASFNSTPKPTLTPQPNPPKILADTLVERPFTASTSTPPPATDPDTDIPIPELLKSEISTAYHHLRNRQIQREGGFLRDDDDNGNILEETTAAEPSQTGYGDGAGPRKKVSRFKAARLGLQ